MASMEGQTLAGRYALTERIGTGGMGTVWRARDTMLSRDVAVKILHDHLASDENFAERFRREARSAARLSHANIVTVYDTGEEATVPYIVMELVDGRSLHDRIRAQGPLSVADTLGIASAVLAALAHAHERGLVHRDMKPANVLITPRGEIKVADFGIAKWAEDSGGLTSTGSLIGTAAYLSPEQAQGSAATPRSDLYATGCLLYACLAGRPPFEGDSAVAVAVQHTREAVPPLERPDAPAKLVAVIMQALRKDPEQRYASAGEMSAAIEDARRDHDPSSARTIVAPAPTSEATEVAGTQLVDGRPGATVPVPPATEVISPRPRTRSSWPARILATVAAALLVAAVGWLVASVMNPTQDRGGVIDFSVPSEGAPVQETNASPSPTPSPSPSPSPSPAPQDRPPPLDLPGIDFG